MISCIYSNNLLVFIMQMQCVYFELWAEFLCIIEMNFVLQVGAVSWAVRWHPLTTEAQVRFQANPHGICGGWSGSGTGFQLILFYQYTNLILIFKAHL